jgi:protein-tyrosine kinase
MEKIKEALVKAKSQKPKTSSKKSLVSNLSNLEKELASIVYTTSAVVKLDSGHLEKNRIVTYMGDNFDANVFDSLRTQILQKMDEKGWRSVAIVSPTPESGKTFVAINLAISIAHQPLKTALLLDMDLRKPRVASYLGLHSKKSMNDFFAGEVGPEEVMVNPSIPRLIVMPTARPVPKPSETLSSTKAVDLLTELRDRYDSRIVVVDLPPMLVSDDAMVLIPHVDCVLLVVADGASTQAEIEEAMRHIPKESLLGVVVNKAEIEKKAYYY